MWWAAWLFIGMAGGFLTIGLIFPFLKSLMYKLIEQWTDAITHREVKAAKTPPKSVTEPRTIGGKIGFNSNEEFDEWRKANKIKVNEEAK